ncbi:hypothetical protein LNQ82_07650 [Conchiformibius steedae DSM 2580]|uniref:Uncharacterized protein n=1 Tax=Conchiformibius steedae DSM 2580 TaxID=1121352 RepID=A0AAE9HS20_9NEIS|nr:hypothetical protein [Conchiformibius steedae]QMT34290.1 hypothetical protein H3L98_04740 [Conchiformibius steedae]URD67064.1 hypothetical protein LNQ82_07650 [Conchiformibius steedae DSM 2580]
MNIQTFIELSKQKRCASCHGTNTKQFNVPNGSAEGWPALLCLDCEAIPFLCGTHGVVWASKNARQDASKPCPICGDNRGLATDHIAQTYGW